MNRRSFLKGILLTGIAPVIVRADSLMRIIPREILVAVPPPAIIEPIGVPLSMNKLLWPGVATHWADSYTSAWEFKK